MIPNLNRYLDRLYTTIHSRHEIVVEEFELFDQSATAGRTASLRVTWRLYRYGPHL
jgi:hypothetical protein